MTWKAIEVTTENIQKIADLNDGVYPDESSLDKGIYFVYSEDPLEQEVHLVRQNVFDERFEWDPSMGPGSVKPKH